MADNVTVSTEVSGETASAVVASDDISGAQYQRVKLVLGANGVNDGDVASANPMPVTGPLTDAELRATPLPVSGTVTVALTPPTSLGDGRKTVTAAGTAEALAGSTACKRVHITALEGNSSAVVIGGSSVVALLSTRRGTPLAQGQSLTLAVDNLADIFIDAITTGEGVSYTYEV